MSLYSSDDKWELYARGVNLTGEFYGGSGSNTPFTGNGTLTGSTDPSGLSDILQFIEGGRQITLGVTYRMWRILVSQDAHFIDEAVRD